jgi:hypothetical protein
MVVQTSNQRQCDNLALLRWFDGTRVWGVPIQCPVNSVAVIVVEIAIQTPAEVMLAEHNDVVQALAPDELGLREALFKDARTPLQELYRQPDLSLLDHASQPGEKCHLDRPKAVQTLFGPIELRRTCFYHPASHTGRAPLDQALGLVGSFSPALVRLCARAAAKEGYESASEDLRAQAGVTIDGRQIQRLVNLVAPAVAAQLAAGPPASATPLPVMYMEVDGTGAPMVAEELVGRAGK